MNMETKKRLALKTIKGFVDFAGQQEPFLNNDNEFCAPRASQFKDEFRNYPELAGLQTYGQKRWQGMTYSQVKSALNALVEDGTLRTYGGRNYRRYVLITPAEATRIAAASANAERVSTLDNLLIEALADAGIDLDNLDRYHGSIRIDSAQLAELLASHNVIQTITQQDITDRANGDT